MQPLRFLFLASALAIFSVPVVAQNAAPDISGSSTTQKSPRQRMLTTASGVRITFLKEGKGAAPSPRSIVKVHYRGTLPSGTEFDSSYKRGKPAELSLGQVISCWRQALVLARPGTTLALECPASTAYGDQGMPPSIGPNQTLHFEVQLLDVLS